MTSVGRQSGKLAASLVSGGEIINSINIKTQWLSFEKVGDVNSEYPYLCIYLPGGENPFMEISINSDRQLEFVFYASASNTTLGPDELKEIMFRAEKFLPEGLENAG